MVARKGAGFQRPWLHGGRIRGGVTQLPGDATRSHRLLELGEKGVYPAFAPTGSKCYHMIRRLA